MMPFSTGTGLEHVGVVGLDQDYGQTELEDAGSSGLRGGHCDVDWRAWIAALLCKKTGERGVGEGFARGRSVA